MRLTFITIFLSHDPFSNYVSQLLVIL